MTRAGHGNRIGRRELIVVGVASSVAACSIGEQPELIAADEQTEPVVDTNGLTVGDAFGQVIDVGSLEEVRDDIQLANGFGYKPQARAWLVEYPAEFVDQALGVYPEPIHEGLRHGLLAAYQKCPHLGCRVPECGRSQQFECPCHGSMFTRFGEWIDGPAPRGLDLFELQIVDGRVLVQTARVHEGLPQGTNVTGWKPNFDDTCLGFD